MNCKFCHHPSNAKLCSRCASDLLFYRNALEDPAKSVATSKRCQKVIEQIKHNERHGFYVPPYYAAQREEHHCVQCDRLYHRVSSRSKDCPECKKLARKFSMLKGQGKTHRTSDRMLFYYNVYMRRLEEGREVPRSFITYLEGIEAPCQEYDRTKTLEDFGVYKS